MRPSSSTVGFTTRSLLKNSSINQVNYLFLKLVKRKSCKSSLPIKLKKYLNKLVFKKFKLIGLQLILRC